MYLSLGQAQYPEVEITHCKYILEERERERIEKEIEKLEKEKR